MEIWAFGHKPSSHSQEFKDKDTALDYLRRRLPLQDFRYRTTQNKHATTILFSFNGYVLAELVVDHIEDPNDSDFAGYEKVKKVYVISEIRLFQRTDIKAKDLGLNVVSYGTKVPEDLYKHVVEHQGSYGETVRRT